MFGMAPRFGKIILGQFIVEKACMLCDDLRLFHGTAQKALVVQFTLKE